jgi:hypothetical protein
MPWLLFSRSNDAALRRHHVMCKHKDKPKDSVRQFLHNARGVDAFRIAMRTRAIRRRDHGMSARGFITPRGSSARFTTRISAIAWA